MGSIKKTCAGPGRNRSKTSVCNKKIWECDVGARELMQTTIDVSPSSPHLEMDKNLKCNGDLHTSLVRLQEEQENQTKAR